MLDTTLEQIDTVIAGLRRLITDLRPAALDTFGVKAALEDLAERVAGTSGLEIDLHIDLAFESGRATMRHVPALESTLYLTVSDDGDGFDPSVASKGFGLIGTRARHASRRRSRRRDRRHGRDDRARDAPRRHAPRRGRGHGRGTATQRAGLIRGVLLTRVPRRPR